VTVEEALIALLAIGAGLLLFIGLAQALEDRPTVPERRGRRPGERVRRGRPGRSASSQESPSGGSMAGSAAVGSAEEVHAFEPRPEADAEPAGEAEVTPGPPGDPQIALLEAAVTLYQSAKHQELLATAEPYLRVSEVGGEEHLARSHAMSALWTLAGLSHHALGEHGDARYAFEAALAGALEAPEAGAWEGYPPRLPALAVSVGRRLLELAERAPEGAQERITGPRLAQVWLRWRLALAPGDRAAAALLEHARTALGEGYWEVARTLIRRRDFGEARALVQQGMDREELATDRGQALLEMLSASLLEEIERLTRPAIRGLADETQAVVALETAQAMLAGLGDGRLPGQDAAMLRRLWRGYAKLGIRRLKAGNLEAAVEALFHALGMREIDARRQRQVRDALVRTLEGIAEADAEAVPRLLAEGQGASAAQRVQRLLLHIQRAREEGISREELGEASERARRLVERIDQARVR
jgi:tetratricopeptide (TPR) repeat protein